MERIGTELAENSYRGREIRLCKDGYYRWEYALNMYTNPVVFLTVAKIFVSIVLIGFLLFGFFLYVIHGDWEGLLGMGKAMLVTLGILLALAILGYLIVAVSYHGKYIVLFEMNEKGIRHTQVPEQFKKAQRLAKATAVAGAVARRPGTAGAGLLAASKQTSSSDFSRVRSVRPLRLFHTIKVNELLEKNQVYVPKEDFDFVYQYIKSRCPGAK